MLESLTIGAIVLLVLALRDRSPSHSAMPYLLASLIMLPILLLGGYLSAHWQWQDLQKKYPEDRQPPWE